MTIVAGDTVALSLEESRLWAATGLRGNCPCYNIPVLMRFEHGLDAGAFCAAFDVVAQAHPALGMRVRLIGDRLCKDYDAQRPPVERHDLSALAEHLRNSSATELCNQIARTVFDLETGPVYRAALLTLTPGRHWFVFCMHHIAFDATSLDRLLTDLKACYADLLAGCAPRLDAGALEAPGIPRPETDPFWKDKLAGAPPLARLPTAATRPPVPSYRGTYHRSPVPADTVARLAEVARQCGVTFFVMLKTLCDLLLFRFGIDDSVIGTPMSARGQLADTGAIGYHMRMYVFRTRLASGMTVRDVLKANQDDLLNGFDAPSVDFEAVLSSERYHQDPAFDPVFQVMFHHTESARHYRFGDNKVQPVYLETGFTKTDLELAFLDEGGVLNFRTHARDDLFTREVVGAFHTQMAALCDAVSTDPDVDLAAVGQGATEVLAHGIAPGFGSDAVAFADGFAGQVRATPDAPAIVSAEGCVSYGELGRMAGAAAARLQGFDLEPGTTVGLCMRSSVTCIVAQIAGLILGLCVKPLDFSMSRTQVRSAVGDIDSGLVLLDGEAFEELFDMLDITLVSLSPAADAEVAPRAPATDAGCLNALRLADATVSQDTLARLPGHMSAVMGELPPDMALTAPPWTEAGLVQTFVPLSMGAAILLADGPGALAAAQRSGRRFHWVLSVQDVLRWSGQEVWAKTVGALHLLSEKPVSAAVSGELAAQGAAVTDRWLLSGAGYGTALVAGPRDTDPTCQVFRPVLPLRILCDHGGDTAHGGIGEMALDLSGDSNGMGQGRHRMDRLARWTDPEQIELVADRARDRWHGNGGPVPRSAIEACAERHGDVIEAFVVPQTPRALCPYVLALHVTDNKTETAQGMGRFLSGSLPGYLRPHQVVALARSPRRHDGTLDAARLLDMAGKQHATPDKALSDTTEALISGFWSEVLGHRVGTAQNFFDAGGDSIKLTRLRDLMNRNFQLSLRIVDLFRYSTIETMAEHVRGLAGPGAQDRPMPQERAAEPRRRFVKRKRPQSVQK